MGGKKKKAGGASKKTVDKYRSKIVEDKTFGLKNKNKSKKVQRYIAEARVTIISAALARSRHALAAQKRFSSAPLTRPRRR